MRGPRVRGAATAVGVAGWMILASCDGAQSALAPAGRDAEQIRDLFAWMSGGALVIWGLVMTLALYALHHRGSEEYRVRVRLLIIGGGTILPTITVTILLLYGLGMMPDLLEEGDEGGPMVTVVGEQWWWRVQYALPSGASFELANELWLPRGRRTNVRLRTADVIHSFWVPALAGKVDMIPGRVNRAALEPTRTGVFRGVCAEYCGLSHARMAFDVTVVEPEAFEDWVSIQTQPAEAPSGTAEERGAELFAALGCGACHAIRGTGARGEIGPDLTHVGSRRGLGAGILQNDDEGFERWLRSLDHLKPGVHMPAFDMLPEDDLEALAAFLEGLD